MLHIKLHHLFVENVKQKSMGNCLHFGNGEIMTEINGSPDPATSSSPDGNVDCDRIDIVNTSSGNSSNDGSPHSASSMKKSKTEKNTNNTSKPDGDSIDVNGDRNKKNNPKSSSSEFDKESHKSSKELEQQATIDNLKNVIEKLQEKVDKVEKTQQTTLELSQKLSFAHFNNSSTSPRSREREKEKHQNLLPDDLPRNSNLTVSNSSININSYNNSNVNNNNHNNNNNNNNNRNSHHNHYSNTHMHNHNYNYNSYNNNNNNNNNNINNGDTDFNKSKRKSNSKSKFPTLHSFPNSHIAQIESLARNLSYQDSGNSTKTRISKMSPIPMGMGIGTGMHMHTSKTNMIDVDHDSNEFVNLTWNEQRFDHLFKDSKQTKKEKEEILTKFFDVFGTFEDKCKRMFAELMNHSTLENDPQTSHYSAKAYMRLNSNANINVSNERGVGGTEKYIFLKYLSVSMLKAMKILAIKFKNGDALKKIEDALTAKYQSYQTWDFEDIEDYLITIQDTSLSDNGSPVHIFWDKLEYVQKHRSKIKSLDSLKSESLLRCVGVESKEQQEIVKNAINHVESYNKRKNSKHVHNGKSKLSLFNQNSHKSKSKKRKEKSKSKNKKNGDETSLLVEKDLDSSDHRSLISSNKDVKSETNTNASYNISDNQVVSSDDFKAVTTEPLLATGDDINDGELRGGVPSGRTSINMIKSGSGAPSTGNPAILDTGIAAGEVAGVQVHANYNINNNNSNYNIGENMENDTNMNMNKHRRASFATAYTVVSSANPDIAATINTSTYKTNDSILFEQQRSGGDVHDVHDVHDVPDFHDHETSTNGGDEEEKNEHHNDHYHDANEFENKKNRDIDDLNSKNGNINNINEKRRSNHNVRSKPEYEKVHKWVFGVFGDDRDLAYKCLAAFISRGIVTIESINALTPKWLKRNMPIKHDQQKKIMDNLPMYNTIPRPRDDQHENDSNQN